MPARRISTHRDLAGIAGSALRADAAAARQADHRDHPGRRARRRRLVTDVTAPLVSGAPQALDVTIPCQAVANAARRGGVVFSTIPDDGIDAGRNGLFVRANADVVFVAFRDTVAAVAPRAAVDSGACSALHVWANVGAVGADFVGIPGATGTLPPRSGRRSRASSPTSRWPRNRA